MKKILLFYILILLVFLLPKYNSDETPDLSLSQNEDEYYNNSAIDDMALAEEEPPQEDNNNPNDLQQEDEEEDEEDKNIMKEWEEYMHDFVPADMLTYEIEKQEKEVLIKIFNYKTIYFKVFL